MPIFRGSRYEGLKFTSIINADGNESRFMHLRTNTVTMEDVGDDFKMFRQRSSEELIDLMAFNEYGKSRLGWVLAEVNNLSRFEELVLLDSIILPSKEFMADF